MVMNSLTLMENWLMPTNPNQLEEDFFQNFTITTAANTTTAVNPAPPVHQWTVNELTTPFSDADSELQYMINKYVNKAGEKKVVTKKAPPVSKEPMPETLPELKKLVQDQNNLINYLNSQIAHFEKEHGRINEKYRELVLRTHNMPDMDTMVQAIQVYCKMHKLNYKPRKDHNILNGFIAALEYKDVPIGDDALVD